MKIRNKSEAFKMPKKRKKRGKNRKKSVQHKIHEGDTDDQTTHLLTASWKIMARKQRLVENNQGTK